MTRFDALNKPRARGIFPLLFPTILATPIIDACGGKVATDQRAVASGHVACDFCIRASCNGRGTWVGEARKP